ncbi:MAG: AAA family ATPase [Candidatus Absconditabacterales bacterium]|nr:AAA family ATPase [Candidatus Absconditabacterales bacterium]
MVVKHVGGSQTQSTVSLRPQDLSSYFGQDHIKRLLDDAVRSAQKRQQPLGHILLSGPSGYGKTTLASLIASQLGAQFYSVTGYAISKPADIISLLTSLQPGDVLFIDEIHRIKPSIEELLYIAMEDFSLDVVMPEGGSMKIPLVPFTLIGATTNRDQLTEPLKNRFVYDCQFVPYSDTEKIAILTHYLALYGCRLVQDLIPELATYCISVPRVIHTFVIKVRDWMISYDIAELTPALWEECRQWMGVEKGGLMPLHQRYLAYLTTLGRPTGLKTLAMHLGVSEQTIERDIEPLLFHCGKIEKTPRGRICVG